MTQELLAQPCCEVKTQEPLVRKILMFSNKGLDFVVKKWNIITSYTQNVDKLWITVDKINIFEKSIDKPSISW